MISWQEQLKVDQSVILISSKNKAIEYFTMRDILDQL